MQKWILTALLSLFILGCQPPCDCDTQLNASVKSASFGVADVRSVALSKIISAENGANSRIRLLLELLDDYTTRIKAPFVVRFELYQYQKDVPGNIGTRLKLFNDLDLVDSKINNSYWNDFLRCYEFDLNMGFAANKGDIYTLLLTFYGTNGNQITKKLILTAP